MTTLLFLIPLSIVLLIGAGIVLFWAVDHGQFEDMDTPGLLPLVDADRSQRSPAVETLAPRESTNPTAPPR